jgi:hypothetical protein
VRTFVPATPEIEGVFAFTSRSGERRRSHGRGRCAAGALLALAVAAPASAAAQPLSLQPIPWQDAAPAAVPFLQLPFESPATVDPGHLQIGIRTIYSNSIARASSSDVLVSYDLETAQPTLALRYGLRQGLELHVEVPSVAEVNPGFGSAIEGVEAWFHTENKLRRGVMPARAEFRLVRPDGRGTSFTGASGGLGDVWIGAKWLVHEQDGWIPGLAWRAALKLPTGGFPFGSGTLEGGFGMLADAGLGRTHLWLAADLMVPDGPVSSARLATRPHAAFQLGLGRQLSPHVLLLLQGSTHGPALRSLHLSEIDGWTFYVLAGARVTPTPSLSVGVGVAENLLVAERGTDIAAIVDLAWRF